jgi:hypothetical protein
VAVVILAALEVLAVEVKVQMLEIILLLQEMQIQAVAEVLVAAVLV